MRKMILYQPFLTFVFAILLVHVCDGDSNLSGLAAPHHPASINHSWNVKAGMAKVEMCLCISAEFSIYDVTLQTFLPSSTLLYILWSRGNIRYSHCQIIVVLIWQYYMVVTHLILIARLLSSGKHYTDNVEHPFSSKRFVVNLKKRIGILILNALVIFWWWTFWCRFCITLCFWIIEKTTFISTLISSGFHLHEIWRH